MFNNKFWGIIPNNLISYPPANCDTIKHQNYNIYLGVDGNIHKLSENEGFYFTKIPQYRFSEEKIFTFESFKVDYYKKDSGAFLLLKFNYTSIIYDEKEISIFNDREGIDKFFYIKLPIGIIASNDFWWVFKHLSNYNLSVKNIGNYLLNNYFIGNQTIVEEIKKSIPATLIKISESKIQIDNYFSKTEELKNKKINYTQKESLEYSKSLWTNILEQSYNYINENPSITLTGGLDSRLILSGLRNKGMQTNAFTFGNSQSMDVQIAIQLSNHLHLNHYHFDIDNNFYKNFHDNAVKVIRTGMSLVSIGRSFRYLAYSDFSNHTNHLYFGFIGSELLRGGVYPDGLMYSDVVTDYWTNELKDFESYFKNTFLDLDPSIKNEILNNSLNYEWMKNPDTYVFTHVIPNHFAQDFKLLDSFNMQGVAPFWDYDFVEFIQQTPYFINNNKKSSLSKHGHLKRIDGPKFTCVLISYLDKESAKFTLGKGYSPLDYSKSKYLAGLKFVTHKVFGKKLKYSPVLKYTEQYKIFLESVFNDYSYNELPLNKNKLINYLKNHSGWSEKSYLSFTLCANLILINNELKSIKQNHEI